MTDGIINPICLFSPHGVSLVLCGPRDRWPIGGDSGRSERWFYSIGFAEEKRSDGLNGKNYFTSITLPVLTESLAVNL